MQYGVFLRGMNVGKRRLKMKEIADCLTEAGCGEVQTILATGNLIIQTDSSPKQLREDVEQRFRKCFDLFVPVFVFTKKDIQKMVEKAPYMSSETHHSYVFLHEIGFEKTLEKEFEKITPIEGEAGTLVGDTFYWHCPKGVTLDAGFSKILGRASLREAFTSRNINTLLKMLEKMK